MKYATFKQRLKKFDLQYNRPACLSYCFDEYLGKHCNLSKPDQRPSAFCLDEFVDFKWHGIRDKFCIPNCPIICKVKVFKKEFDYFSFPNQDYIQDDRTFLKLPIKIQRGIQVNMSYYRERMVKLIVRYKSLQSLIISESPKTTIDSLIGNIGGILGCFLGASLLSLVEVFELMVKITFKICEKKTKNPIQISS